MRRKTIDTIPVLSDVMKKHIICFFEKLLPSVRTGQKSQHCPSCVTGELNRNIAPQVGLHCNNVATWRSRFLAALPALRKIKMDTPDKLEDEIRAVLSDKKRPGTQFVFMPNQIMRVFDLVCSKPNDFGYEVN